MNILWLTWKDIGHPEAGGAEVVCYELCKRLVADNHAVTLLTTDYEGAKEFYALGGVRVIRVGRSRTLHPYQALFYYVRRLRNQFDLVIEEVNGGAPYFSVFFGRKKPRYMLYHQLARTNWLYEVKAPLSYLGYSVMVPLATRLASLARTPVITVSESTRQELSRFGFGKERTHIISEGLHVEPVDDLKKVKKYDRPTLLIHGSMRAMKRTLDQVKAFEIAKETIPEMRLKISGSASGEYGQQVIQYIAKSRYKKDIHYVGRTTDEEKVALMRASHVFMATAAEEGWCLVVTESNSQGTPAVVYNVRGLRDSVRHEETGIVTDESPEALARGIIRLLADPEQYAKMQHNAWRWSKEITFEKSYQDFKRVTGIA